MVSRTGVGVDKGEPPLRQWELDSNSSRYDKNLAAPSDEELIPYWSAWAGIAMTAGLFTLVVFLSVLCAPKRSGVRKQSFNIYLMYLMIPDFCFSLLCGLTCLLNAVHGHYWSHWMCNFQQWYCVWGIGSNCWLNAIITYELHKLLKCSHQRRRYTIPPPKTVTLQALTVYAYCAFLGTWGLYEKKNFPLHALQINGLACIPVEVDFESSLFFWLLFLPLFSVIPILYVVYVCWDIRRRQLLPPSGKRRLLALYFGRIILVFLALWGPYFLLNYILATWLPTSVVFAGGTLSHLQGPISAGVSMMKPDIWYSVKRFVQCKWCCYSDGEDSDGHQASTEEFKDLGLDTSVKRSMMRRVSSLFRPSGFFQTHDAGSSSSLAQQQRIGGEPSSLSQSLVEYSCIWPEEDGTCTQQQDDVNDDDCDVDDNDNEEINQFEHNVQTNNDAVEMKTLEKDEEKGEIGDNESDNEDTDTNTSSHGTHPPQVVGNIHPTSCTPSL